MNPISSSVLSTPRRATLALAAIVAAYVAFYFFAPDREANSWANDILTGIAFSPPILFGTWTAIGPGSAIKRLPLTLIALLLTTTAMGVQLQLGPAKWRFNDALFENFGLFLAATLEQWIIFKALGWRIHMRGNEFKIAPSNFSLRFLVGLITAASLSLGIVKLLISTQGSSRFDLINTPIQAAEFVGVISLLILPIVNIPLGLIATKFNHKIALSMLAAWVASFIGVLALVTILQPGQTQDFASHAFRAQLGGALAAAIVAIPLRLAGYRLFTHAHFIGDH